MIEPMDRFEPRAALKSGHRMTLYGWGNPRHFPRLAAPTRRLFDVARDARVLADCHWQPRPWQRPTLLALHGLNGSSDAHYMRGLASKAYARGMNVVLLNQRHLRRLLRDYVRYYHEDRTHLGLRKDTPGGRVTAGVSPHGNKIISLPRLGGLHHRYTVAA